MSAVLDPQLPAPLGINQFVREDPHDHREQLRRIAGLAVEEPAGERDRQLPRRRMTPEHKPAYPRCISDRVHRAGER